MTRRESIPLAAESLLNAARHAPMLSAEEELRLANAAVGGNQRAFDMLLRAHLRLVLTIAYEFRSYGLPLDELASEGLLGLVEATRRFEAERGVRLAVYAAWWIRAYMRRYTIANRRIVRTPSSRHGRKLLANLRKTQRAMAQRDGEAPDAEAVARELGVGVRDVQEMEAALSGRDVPCNVEVGGRTFDVASEEPSPEAIVARAQEVRSSSGIVDRALSTLSERERRVIEGRHLAEDAVSLASIGRSLGLSRERVRQIERDAEVKVRVAVLSAVA